MTTQLGLCSSALALIAAVSFGLACGSESAPNAVPAFAGSSPELAGAGSGREAEAAPVAPGQAAAGETTNVGALSPAGTAPPGDGAGGPSTSGGSAGAGAGAAMNGAAGAPASGAPGAGGAMPGAMGAGGEPATAPGSVFPDGVARPQIMIVGDSISAGPGCYKKYLLADLQAGGFTSFDFVGEYTDDCGGGVRHSARSCSTAEQYAQPTFTLAAGSCNPSGTFPGMSQLVAKYRPDLVLLQLGVNDVWGGRSTDAVLASYTTLVQQARAQNPNVVIAVAQIQQIRPTTDGDAVFARAQQLVNAVPGWARSQSQPASPVVVACRFFRSAFLRTASSMMLMSVLVLASMDERGSAAYRQ